MSRSGCWNVRERANNPQQAVDTHHQFGKEVRETIRRSGSTPPGSFSLAEPIQQDRRRPKGAIPEMQLEGKHAKGLEVRTGCDSSRRG